MAALKYKPTGKKDIDRQKQDGFRKGPVRAEFRSEQDDDDENKNHTSLEKYFISRRKTKRQNCSCTFSKKWKV